MGDQSTTQAIVEALTKKSKPETTLITDGNKSYAGLEPVYTVNAQKNDYINRPERLRWFNTIVSNLKAFIQGTYHGIAKKYLVLLLAEFEWIFNRRKIGMGKLTSAVKAMMSATPMRCKDLVSFFNPEVD